jgi:hypothetical protein
MEGNELNISAGFSFKMMVLTILAAVLVIITVVAIIATFAGAALFIANLFGVSFFGYTLGESAILAIEGFIAWIVFGFIGMKLSDYAMREFQRKMPSMFHR